jgi:hypothetical protein
MANFNNQFATQKLRQEMSVTGTGATFTPGTGEQTAPRATKKVVKKKLTPEEKDVEPKLAAGKAKVYMKDKWGWKDAPSIPNRPSKGGFMYKQLFEELNDFVKENKLNIKSIGDFNYNMSMLGLAAQQMRDEQMFNTLAKLRSQTDLMSAIAILDEIKMKIENAQNLDRITKKDALKAIENIRNEYEPEEQGDDEDSYDWFTNSNINESYSKFKTETKTRGKSDQFHQAVREVRKKVQEINRLFEYVNRLKSELSEGEGGLKYKMHTEKALAKIKEMVSELNQNIKKFK